MTGRRRPGGTSRTPRTGDTRARLLESLAGRQRARSWIRWGTWGMRGMRRLARRHEDVHRVELRPGETIEVRHLTERYGDTDGQGRGQKKPRRGRRRDRA